MRSTETEVALMREQLARGAGIYGCDEWAVYSDEKMWLSPGPPTRLDTTLIAADLNKTGDGINTKYKNSKQFLRAWERMREDGQYKDQDWVVKVDPDTVFFPQRLKLHLAAAGEDPSRAKFFANCRTKDHPHFMFGALEVFSVAAAEEFFKHGHRCEKELKSDQMWEERYISHCLHLLEVHMDSDFALLRDGHCDLKPKPLMPCVDDEAVAFHPLRSPSEYFTCRGQAQQHWEDSQKEKEEKDKETHKKDEGDEDEKKGDEKHAKKEVKDDEEQKKAGEESQEEGDVKSHKEKRSQHGKSEEEEEIVAKKPHGKSHEQKADQSEDLEDKKTPAKSHEKASGKKEEEEGHKKEEASHEKHEVAKAHDDKAHVKKEDKENLAPKKEASSSASKDQHDDEAEKKEFETVAKE